MNKTKIDWCDRSWNPVTGCMHDCPYCYARRIAERFGMSFAPRLGDPGMEGACKYDIPLGMDTMLELKKPYKRDGHIQPFPMAFAPTFHRYRLNEPALLKKPQTIFVCSMADLFGDWVPDEWIMEVFKACEAAPQHRYLFLTKNPARYRKLYESKLLPYHDNYWFGSTVTRPYDEFTWFDGTPYHSFVSVEPLLSPLGKIESGRWPDWIIIGAETGNRKGKVIPEREWIEDIVGECGKYGIPVFMKESLRGLMGTDFVQEFPWGDEQKCMEG